MGVIDTLKKLGACEGGKVVYKAAKRGAQARNANRKDRTLKAETKRRMWFLFPDLDLDRVRFSINSALPPNWFTSENDVEGMTFGYRIFFKGSGYQTTDVGLRVLVHELVHVDQVRRRGDDEGKFACDYGTGYRSGGWSYEDNPLEQEAYSWLPADVALPGLVEETTLHVFTVSQAGALDDYHWSPTPGWACESINQTAGAAGNLRIEGKPAVIPLSHRLMPDVLGRRADGHLIHYYWSARPSWAVEDLTAVPGIGSAFAIAGTPVADSFTSGEAVTGHVYGRTAGGHLAHYYWTARGGWGAEDLSVNTGADWTLAGEPVADNFLSGTTVTAHVYGRTTDGHLAHYYWSAASGWRADDLSLKAGASWTLAGNPAADNFLSGQTRTAHVYARSTAGHLVHYYWTAANGWVSEDLNVKAGAIWTLAGDPIVAKPFPGQAGTVDVYGRTTDGHLAHYYWSAASGWRSEDLTAKTGAPSQLAGEPVADSFLSGATPTAHVYGQAADGHLLHYFWSAAKGWGAEDLSQELGVAWLLSGDPMAFNSAADKTLGAHIYGRSTDGHLVHYYWARARGWAAEDLTLKTGATSPLGPSPLGPPLLVQLPY